MINKKFNPNSFFGENIKRLPLFIDYLIIKENNENDNSIFKKHKSKKLNTKNYILKNNHKVIHPLFIKTI